MPNQTYVRYDQKMDALKKKKKLLDKTQPPLKIDGSFQNF